MTKKELQAIVNEITLYAGDEDYHWEDFIDADMASRFFLAYIPDVKKVEFRIPIQDYQLFLLLFKKITGKMSTHFKAFHNRITNPKVENVNLPEKFFLKAESDSVKKIPKKYLKMFLLCKEKAASFLDGFDKGELPRTPTNIYVTDPTYNLLLEMLFEAYKKGVKDGKKGK